VGGADGIVQIDVAGVAQRARPVAHEPRRHRCAADVDWPVVSEPQHKHQQVIGRVAHRGALRPNPDCDRLAPTGVAECLHERVGEPGALAAWPELGCPVAEWCASAGIRAKSELLV
jgi:hypothetical protein